MSYQPVMDHGPLPESSFVTQTRASIPPPRVTTAMASGRVRRRGVTEDIPEDVPQSSHQVNPNARVNKRQVTGRGGRGNGRGRGGRGNGRGSATGGTRGGGRGAGRGNATGGARGAGRVDGNGGRTEPGAGLWNLMLGANADNSHVGAEEESVTQNAPQGDEWTDDFLSM